MELKLVNRLIVPYTDKETFKVIFGDTQEFNFKLPTPHQAGDTYQLGIDQDRVVYPPSRPLCAYTTAFTVDGDVLTMTLKYNTSRLRDFVSSLKKPTTIYIQLDRVRNNRAETLLLDTLLAMPSVLDSVNTVCEGDPLEELLNAKLDKPAIDGTEGQILSLDENGQNVWRDEQEIPEQEQADWDESDSTNVSYIRNKPIISEVGHTGEYTDILNTPDLTVYVEKEEGKGLSTNDYTDADKEKLGGIENGAEVNVQADWDESDSAVETYIRNKPSLATVATSGSYTDLSNKPDLTVYSLVTETGNKISMSIDEEYDLVVSLLDKNDNVLSTQDIDLPIESMIVDATYSNGVLTLTLQNGNTVDVDISDVVSGLVPDSRTVNGHALNDDVTITASDLGLATVATSGSYNDLIDKPVVEQADWDESDSTEASYIRNKPDVIEAPATAGTAGQVLTIGSSSPEWADVPAELPVATSSDSGKVLTVNSSGSPEWADVPTELPSATSSDSGKVLTVNSSGSPEWAEAQGGGDVVSNVDYLCFKRQNSNYQVSSTVKLNKVREDYFWADINLEYSTDKINWTAYTWNGNTGEEVSIGHNSQVYFRGQNTTFSSNTNFGYFQFVFTGTNTIVASGNIMSLLDKNCVSNSIPDYAFRNLFQNCTVLVAPPDLPAREVGAMGYNSMFKNSGIEYLPKFGCPSMQNCSNMFQNCVNLKEVDIDVYEFSVSNSMFMGCTGIKKARIKAFRAKNTSLMAFFYGCTNLEFVELDVKNYVANYNQTIDNFCNGCSNLKHVRLVQPNFPINNANWLSGVSSNGVFECDKSTTIPSRDASGVPSGWVIVRTDISSASGASLVSVASTSSTYTVFPSTDIVPIIGVSSALALSATTGTGNNVSYAEVVLDIDANATVTAGTNLTLVDTPTAGKRNVCVVRWSGGTAKLYVTIVEDLPQA